MSYGGYQQYGGNPYEQSGQAEAGYGSQGRAGVTNDYGQSAGYAGASENPYGSSAAYGSQPIAQAESRYEQGAGYAAAPAAAAASYGAENPYGSGDRYGAQGGYGAPATRPMPSAMTSDYSQNSDYVRPVGASNTQTQNVVMAPVAAIVHQGTTVQPGYNHVTTGPTTMINEGTAVLTNDDFLGRVENTRSEIRQLTANVAEIGTIHQRVLGSPDNSSSAQLENLVAQTQVLNTRIKDQIKFLETDAAKSLKNGSKNTTKDSQVRTLKQNFKSQLEDYQKEEQVYRQRYREQIARQYRIVNPEATDAEVHEATDADWGNEGVFQTALKSNRTGAANSVLGSVRARHNDIQNIEKTLIELNQLFQDLAEVVILQEAPIQQAAAQTQRVEEDTTAGNKHLAVAEGHARHRRKLKWWCFFIIVLIIVILGLVLGLYFGLRKK